MLTLANLRPGETVYDLGAGDGRILSAAVRDFNAKALGVELHPSRYEAITKRIRTERLGDSAKVIQRDFLDIKLSKADVVTLYLLTSVNSLLRPKLERELKPNTRVVSHDFPIRGWKPLHVEKVWAQSNNHIVYLYEMPQSLPSPRLAEGRVPPSTRLSRHPVSD